MSALGVCMPFNSFYKFIFSILGLHMPFNSFKIGVFNHLMIDPSQLNLVS